MLETRIRESRLRRGWNQAELAQHMHVAQPTVSAWETGLKAPRLKILLRLSAVLGVNFQWLSTGEGEPYSKVAELLKGGGESAHIADGYDLLDQDEEERLLASYMQLSAVQRQALLALLESFRIDTAGGSGQEVARNLASFSYPRGGAQAPGTGPDER